MYMYIFQKIQYCVCNVRNIHDKKIWWGQPSHVHVHVHVYIYIYIHVHAYAPTYTFNIFSSVTAKEEEEDKRGSF